MKLKLLSTCGIAIYLLAFMSCTRTAESIELLESKETAPYQVILLVNDKYDDELKTLIWDFAATGVILNKRWVLTAQSFESLLPAGKDFETCKVIAGDANFMESKVDISSRYRQTLMVSQQIQVKKLVLLQVAADFYIDGVNIQKVQLPKTYLPNSDDIPRTFEYGFPSGDHKCKVSGWKNSREVQRVGKVKVDTTTMFRPVNEHMMVKSAPFGLNQRTIKSIYKFFKKNECLRGDCERFTITGFPLVCRQSKWHPWILMGLGDYQENWEDWQNTIAPFARVSPYIGDLRAEIVQSTSDLYIYQGIEGQPRKFPFQALVKVAYNNDQHNLVEVCQGVILSETRVLTAASCFDPVNGVVVRVAVVIGITDLNDANINNQHEASDWWQYDDDDIDLDDREDMEEYEGRYADDSDFDFYNMALIGFQQHLPLDDNTRSIGIAESNEETTGCTVSGWERMSNGQYDPNIRYGLTCL